MRLVGLAIVGLALCSVSHAEEPTGNRIFPTDALFKLISRATDDGSLFLVETTTMGRVENTGYVWTVLLRALPGSTPEATRLVINCEYSSITEDWQTVFSADLQSATHTPRSEAYPAVDPSLQTVVGLACGGEPALPDVPGLQGLVDWAKTLPPNVYEPELDAVINVTESGSGGAYMGSWIHRPFPGNRIYDGTWVNLATGEITTDTVAGGPIINGLQTIERTGTGGSYTIPYYGAFPQPGTASWVTDPSYSIEISVWAENPTVTAAGLVEDAPAPVMELPPDGTLPPAFNSFVQINEGDLPVPLKVFFDEGSATFPNSEGIATAWQFYAYATPLKYPSGAEAIGGWVRMDYECDAKPLAWSPALIIQVGPDYQNLPSVAPNPQRFVAAAGSVEEGVAAHACFGDPMPLIEFLPRFASIEETIAEAKAP